VFFAQEWLIPANTPVDDPYHQTFQVCEGVVRKVWVRWRYGVGNLAGCRILRGEFQVWPLTIGEWLSSSHHPIEFEEDYSIGDVPFYLDVYAYNLDDTFDHRLFLGVEILRPGLTGPLADFLGWIAKGGGYA
jgi:hypothetical protein